MSKIEVTKAEERLLRGKREEDKFMKTPPTMTTGVEQSLGRNKQVDWEALKSGRGSGYPAKR